MSRTGAISAGVSLAETRFVDESRRELRAGTTGVDLELGGVVIRAGDLPLLREQNGALRQCLRLAVFPDGDRGVAHFSALFAGTRVDSASLETRTGSARVHLFVPAVDEATTVELEIELAGGLRRVDTLVVKPQRRWRIFVVHHSHLDIGYTDPQARVLRQHLAYLDSALDYAARDNDFRWTIESNLVLERWLASRPQATREELLELLRTRRFEVCALPFTMHAEACSIDELARQLRFTHELRDRYGVDVVSAMQTDVPGGPPGLPLVLADAHVPYLAVAHNWAGRATPYLTGGAELPRAFHWRTGAGKHVLVWHTDSPHGIAYLEGNLLGLAESHEAAGELLPEYLAALSTRGHPYTGVLGVPIDREPYPHDVLHLRVQGVNADNAAPSPVPAEIARRWNEHYAYPQLCTATNRDFFEALPTDGLRTFTGDWADWWADGLGSAARQVGFNRRAQAIVRTAQTLHTVAGPGTEHAADTDRVYESMSLFDEHTWCAAHPGGDALAGRESSALQWQAKASLAADALDRAESLLDAAVARFRSPKRRTSVLVLNAGGFERTDVVSVFLPISRVEPGRTFTVVDAETGERVAHALAPPETARNRPGGQALSFVAERVPAVGYRRYDLVAEPAAEINGKAGELETDQYRVELDVAGGYALHVLDKALGLDLVDATSAFGLGQVVHDRYGSALQATMRLAPGGAQVTPAHDSASDVFIASRTTPQHGVVVSRVSNPVEERVTVRVTGAGCDWIETTYRLVHGVRRLDVAHRLSKRSTVDKEGLFVLFPFGLEDPSVAYELTGGVGGGPRVPGGAEHFHAVRHWVALQDSSRTVAWSTLEAPLVQFGNLFLPYPPYPPTVDDCGGGTIASWTMNNVWDTNFPLTQDGETTFSYALSSAPPDADAHSLGIATAAALTQPLVGVLGGERDHPAGALCEIDAPGVEVALIAATDRGFVVHLQSYADDDVEVHVAGERMTIRAGDYVAVSVGRA